MDQTQVNELRAWARRLEEREGGHEEVRAAAKAILMLADERLDSAAAERPSPVHEPDAAPAAEPAWETADDRTSGSFLSRVKRTFGVQ